MEGLRIHKSDSMKEILKQKPEKISKEYQPSSASMDRLKVTDEYIKKLEDEKNELQEKLTRQEKVIDILQGQLTANGIPILSGTITSILNGEISEAPSTSSKESNEEDIPQRSVRRQMTPQKCLKNKTSSSSLGSNRSLQMPKSPIGHLSPTSPVDRTRDYESNRSSVYSDIEDGTSYRRSLTQAEDLSKSSNKDNANETIEMNHNDTINEDSDLKQVEQSNRTFEPSDESSINTVLENTKVKPTTNGAMDNKLPTNDSISTKKEISTTNLLNTNDEMKTSGLVTQHKNTSTSSFNSNYKSRIKLPPSLQPPQKQGKDLSIDTSIASSSGMKALNSAERNDSIGRQISNDQISIQSLITTPMEGPPSQSTPKLGSDTGSFRKLPLTPEMGGFNGKFAQRSNDQLTGDSQTHIQQPIPDNDSTLLRTPITNEFLSHDSESLSRLSTQTPNSSFQVLHTPKTEEDSALFIKPDEFQTISLTVVSTINISNSASSKKDDPACTISINDRESKKEMWRIRKTHSQLMAFDNEIRPIVEYFGLPPIPDKSLFLSTSPNKVDARKNNLQNYFNTIFLMPHLPHIILYRICKYLSLDFINPLDDFRSGARKEGYLIRRYKGLGSSWKIRWCQVDGPFLEIYEIPGGVCIEQIKLKGSQIGKQTNDSVAEERGYRHAFLIMEPQKKISSSSSKYFFCAESDEERDDWVEALVEFNEVGDTSMTSYGSNDNDNSFSTDLDGRYKDNQEEEITKQYSSQTSNSQTGFVGGYHYQQSTSSIDLPNNNNAEKPSQKDLKEAKRLKKRSIFPFRNKLNSLMFDSNPTDTDLSQTIVATQPQQEQQQETNIQLYLDLMNLDDDLTKAIFGRELSVAYELSNHKLFDRSIPSICYRCLDFLLKAGAIYEEGIFRLSGSASSIRQLKDQFNTNFDLDLFESPLQPDMHTVSGLLKTYLRELPTPILGGQQYNDLKHIADTRGESSSRSELALIFRDYLSNSSNIDDIHYNVCYVIFKFLHQIIANKGTNRMNLRNVCIVFVPTLNISLEVLTILLVDFDCVFEGGSPIANDKREVLDLYIPNF